MLPHLHPLEKVSVRLEIGLIISIYLTVLKSRSNHKSFDLAFFLPDLSKISLENNPSTSSFKKAVFSFMVVCKWNNNKTHLVSLN